MGGQDECECLASSKAVDDGWCAKSCYTSAGVNVACDPDTDSTFRLCECTNCADGDDSAANYEEPEEVDPRIPVYEWEEFNHDFFSSWPDFVRSEAWEVTLEKEQPLGQFSYFCNSKIMGGQGRWGNVNWWRDLTVAKGTFKDLPEHKQIRITYDLAKYGTWADNESVELYINDNIVKNHVFATGEVCSEMEHKDVAVVEFPHTDSEIVIEFRTGFDEKSEIWTQAWGIADFYIYTSNDEGCYPGGLTCDGPMKDQIGACKAGYEKNDDGTCSKVDGYNLLEANFYTNNYLTDGWEITDIFTVAPKTTPYTYCLDTLVRFDNGRMLGGANAFCNTDFGNARSFITKTISNLAGHYKLKFEYDMHIFYVDETWDFEEAVFLVVDGKNATSTLNVDGDDDIDCEGSKQKTTKVSVEVPHFADSVDLIFETNLKYAGCYSHSWGINNFNVFILPCPDRCDVCKGGNDGECTACINPNDDFKDGICTKTIDCGIDEYRDGLICEKCDSSCSTCVGPTANTIDKDGCVECAEGYETDDVGNCFKCEGFLLDGICKPCKAACKTCDGPTSMLYTFWGCIDCADGYYQSITDKCEQCDKSCKTCAG